MPAPATRYKLLPARGAYASLAAALADIAEGEIVYATDQDLYYQKEGGVLTPVGVPEAPNDGTQYVRQNQSWAAVDVPPGTIVGTSADLPGTIETGQLWYDTDTSRLLVYTGTEWVLASPAASTAIADNPPSNPQDGDLWFDTSEGSGRLYVYYVDADSSQWVDASPDSAGEWLRDDLTSTISTAIAGDSVDIGSSNILLNADGSASFVGNVGIGTTSPANPLHIANEYPFIRFQSNSGSYQGRNMLGQYQNIFYLEVDNDNVVSNSAFAIKVDNSEAMRIDSSGNVGIGTSSPSESLEVAGNGLKVSGQSTGITDEGITFDWQSSGNNARIFAESAGSSNLLFHTTNSGARGERMRIDSSGRVAIGATSTTSQLRVIGNEIRFSNSANASYYGTITHDAGTTGANIYNNVDATSASHIWQHNGTEVMRIDSSGNVGVGTTSPKFSIQTQNGGFDDRGLGNGVAIRNNIYYSSGDKYLTGSGAASTQYFDPSGNIIFYNTGTASTGADNAVSLSERMRIDSAGRIGINNSSPAATLSVESLAGNSTVGFFKSPTVNAYLQLANSSSDQGYLGYQSSDMTFYTAAAERMRIDSSGNVGVGTTSPTEALTISGNIKFTGTPASIKGSYDVNLEAPNNIEIIGDNDSSGSGIIDFRIGASSRARIDSSGRLLVGTSSAISGSSTNDNLQLVNSAGSILSIASSDTTISDGTRIGEIEFWGQPGSTWGNFATISCKGDATAASNDNPGRLVFSTTADGASGPTERMRITSAGYAKHSSNGVYYNVGAYYHEFYQSLNAQDVIFNNVNASFSATTCQLIATRAATSSYWFISGSSSTGNDIEFYIRGDGNAYADGAWNGGGADYAEYFEWFDGNTADEDRRGTSVVLDGDKIREAVAGEEPIGVISGNPSMVGDADVDRWKGKYLRDDFGSYVWEDYEVVNDEGETVVQQRRKLNPDFNPDTEYVTRENRSEWDCVGLMGKLRIRKGQVTGSRWIKMRDISDSVEEWLVR